MLAERIKQTTADAESGLERQRKAQAAEEEHPELCGGAGDCVVQGTGFGSVKELRKRLIFRAGAVGGFVGDSEEKRCLGEIVLCRRRLKQACAESGREVRVAFFNGG